MCLQQTFAWLELGEFIHFSLMCLLSAPLSVLGALGWLAGHPPWWLPLSSHLASPSFPAACPFLLLSSSPRWCLASLCPSPVERAPGRPGAGPRSGEPEGLDSVHGPQPSSLEVKRGLPILGSPLPAGKWAVPTTLPFLLPLLGFCSC